METATKILMGILGLMVLVLVIFLLFWSAIFIRFSYRAASCVWHDGEYGKVQRCESGSGGDCTYWYECKKLPPQK